jgi:hypothetical protein
MTYLFASVIFTPPRVHFQALLVSNDKRMQFFTLPWSLTFSCLLLHRLRPPSPLHYPGSKALSFSVVILPNYPQRESMAVDMAQTAFHSPVIAPRLQSLAGNRLDAAYATTGRGSFCCYDARFGGRSSSPIPQLRSALRAAARPPLPTKRTLAMVSNTTSAAAESTTQFRLPTQSIYRP